MTSPAEEGEEESTTQESSEEEEDEEGSEEEEWDEEEEQKYLLWKSSMEDRELGEFLSINYSRFSRWGGPQASG